MRIVPETVDALNDLAEACFAAAAAKGFWEDAPAPDDTLRAAVPETNLRPYLGNKIALMHSELSEMLEGLRKPGPDQHLPHRSQEAVEAADVLIRLMDYCGARGIDIGAVAAEKFAYNQSRPFKHGKAF